MNAITKTNEAMMAAIAGAAATIQQETPGQMQFLKLNKVGYWVFGEDDIDIEEDSQWAVNPASFAMGYIAWPAGNKVGAPLGEKMASIYGEAVKESDLPAVDSKWVRQVAMQLVCLNGEDEGEQVQYKASSVGGAKSFGSLLQAVMKHLQTGKAGAKTVPVLELESDSYQHPEYGTINTPVFKILKWIENTGFSAGEEEVEEEEEVEPEAPPKRKRAAKKKAAVVEEVVDEVEEEDEDAEDEPDVEEKPTRRRRRARK